ncbi:MAG TPA: hypothetical protein GX710_01175, partial [Clostridiales bacterium]|nr:hypothetical protein [Clostridiales bacterium]
DMVLVGDGEDYGFEDDTAFQGKKEHWQPLLAEGVTWEELSEIWNGDYIFTEDALSEMAPLIGMDSENIISDYDDLSGKADKNIVELHFKRADKKKAMSLNTAFKQVFGEALEPLGFVKIKSKYPYLVRVVEGGEIIHVITYRNEGVDSFGFRVFNILGGIATVSRQNIDLTLPPIRNLNWFSDNSGLYLRSNPSDFDPEFRKQIDHFAYVVESKKMMIESLNDSLETTKKIMLPIFDQVTDLNACIDFFNKFHPGMLSINVKTEFGDKYIGSTYNEGFLYIKLGREKYIEKKEQHRLQCFAVEAKNRSYSPNTIKQLQETFWGTQEDRFAAYNKIFDDTDWIAKALAELERRKVANTETLRSYGLNL